MFDVVNPRQTVLVTCRGRGMLLGQVQEKDNITPVDWHTPCNVHPFLYGIVLAKDSFSLELIRASKTFVVNFVGSYFKDIVLFAGKHSGRSVDKFKELHLEFEECIKVDCSRLTKAIGSLECELVSEFPFEQYVLVVGKVVYHELKRHDIHRLFHIEKDEFTTIR